MPGSNKARMVALIALLVLTGIALRGHLPGATHSKAAESTGNPGAMIAVIALLCAAIVIITIAIVATMRQPRKPRQDAQHLEKGSGGQRTRPSLRMLLIVLGAILAWLIVVVLLMQLGAVTDLGHPSAPSAPSTAAPSATPAPPPPAPPKPSQQPGGDAFWYLFATTMFMLVLWAAGMVIALVRHQRAPDLQPVDGEGAAPAPEAPHSLAVAAERGLAEMGDLTREPREAIIACYAAMEDALANSPGSVPQDSDTPSEVLARAVDHDAIHAGTANELVDLFAEARFSPHVMNESHREVAVRALQMVLAELKSAA